jgi:hypothetical protein
VFDVTHQKSSKGQNRQIFKNYEGEILFRKLYSLMFRSKCAGA